MSAADDELALQLAQMDISDCAYDSLRHKLAAFMYKDLVNTVFVCLAQVPSWAYDEFKNSVIKEQHGGQRHPLSVYGTLHLVPYSSCGRKVCRFHKPTHMLECSTQVTFNQAFHSPDATGFEYSVCPEQVCLVVHGIERALAADCQTAGQCQHAVQLRAGIKGWHCIFPAAADHELHRYIHRMSKLMSDE
jgi:hypothetical protein